MMKTIIQPLFLFLSSDTSLDIKSIAIIILLSILFGVFLTLRNYRGESIYTDSKSSNSILVFFMFLLLGSAILYSFFNTPNTTSFKGQIENSMRNLDVNRDTFFFDKKNDPINLNNYKQVEKNSSIVSNTRFSSRIRVNQKPSYLHLRSDTYFIQVAALSTNPGALKIAHGLHEHNLVILKDIDGLYKVLITGFSSISDAKKYKKKFGLSGFIGQMEKDLLSTSENY